MLNEPLRWIVAVSVMTAIVLSIWWGLPFERGWDFYLYRDWVWPVLVLSFGCIVGGVLWLFFVHFPSVLNESFLCPILAVVLFVAAFAAVCGLSLGINMVGENKPPAKLIGVITDFKNLNSKAVPSYDREVAVIQVENGPTIEMPIRVLNNLGVKIGFEGKVCVLLYRGNLLYWGWVKSPPCMNE